VKISAHQWLKIGDLRVVITRCKYSPLRTAPPLSSARCCETNSGLAQRHETRSFAAMSMTVDQLVSEARLLPQDLRAELLDRLGLAMHGEASSEVEDSWNQLALSRLAAVESGQSQLLPGEEVMARMRQRIGR
jgi:hypothetical protein